MRSRLITALICAVLALAPAIVFAQGDSAGDTVLSVTRNRVSVTITARPSEVEYDKTILLVIKITAPSEIEVIMPAISDRLSGFATGGSYDQNPPPANGVTTLERHVRLTPLLSNEHRIGPMAILYTDSSKNPAIKGWFHTDPIVFQAQYPIDREPPDDISVSIEPRYIPPSAGTILLWIGLVLAAAIVIYLLWLLSRKLHSQIQLARMSPGERALKELSILLTRNYIEKDMVKQFYLELTMIVRRYIERQHGIRAPEQTTREFLDAVSQDRRFGQETIAKLTTFLEAADLVKFAAYEPDRTRIDNATGTAREYIREDSRSKSLN